MRRISIVLPLLLAACGGPLKYTVASSAKDPGADATIKAEISKGQHLTQLRIDAVHLAPPERVTPGMRIYIIWSRKNSEAQWARVGNLSYDPSAREGTFEGTVPEIDFDMQITVEKDVGAQSPSTDMVFSQHIGPA